MTESGQPMTLMQIYNIVTSQPVPLPDSVTAEACADRAAVYARYAEAWAAVGTAPDLPDAFGARMLLILAAATNRFGAEDQRDAWTKRAEERRAQEEGAAAAN